MMSDSGWSEGEGGVGVPPSSVTKTGKVPYFGLIVLLNALFEAVKFKIQRPNNQMLYSPL